MTTIGGERIFIFFMSMIMEGRCFQHGTGEAIFEGKKNTQVEGAS